MRERGNRKAGTGSKKKVINIGEGQVIAKDLATDGKSLLFVSVL
ncbi:MAG TPA: hypothetical protein VN976_07015 [Verrucomicrobiae bacterium]|nr:hypothetical protein [Verrucomicrobiae bacterium]